MIKATNLFATLSLALCTAACSSDSIVLEGTVKNLAGRPLVYTRTIGGIHLAKLDTVAVRPDSTFRITLPADGVERINFIRLARRIRPRSNSPRLSPSWTTTSGISARGRATRGTSRRTPSPRLSARRCKRLLTPTSRPSRPSTRRCARWLLPIFACNCSSPSSSSTWRPPSATRPTP